MVEMLDLTSMFGDPIVINDQRGRIGGLGLGFGSLFLVVLDSLEEGTRGLSGVVRGSWDQIEHKTSL